MYKRQDLLCSSVGSLTNPSKIADALRSKTKASVSSNTVRAYIEYIKAVSYTHLEVPVMKKFAILMTAVIVSAMMATAAMAAEQITLRFAGPVSYTQLEIREGVNCGEIKI